MRTTLRNMCAHTLIKLKQKGKSTKRSKKSSHNRSDTPASCRQATKEYPELETMVQVMWDTLLPIVRDRLPPLERC